MLAIHRTRGYLRPGQLSFNQACVWSKILADTMTKIRPGSSSFSETDGAEQRSGLEIMTWPCLSQSQRISSATLPTHRLIQAGWPVLDLPGQPSTSLKGGCGTEPVYSGLLNSGWKSIKELPVFLLPTVLYFYGIKLFLNWQNLRKFHFKWILNYCFIDFCYSNVVG